MKGSDFIGWLKEYATALESAPNARRLCPLTLGPRPSDEELQNLESRWAGRLPATLVDFWLAGGSGLVMRYALRCKAYDLLFLGPGFGASTEIPVDVHFCEARDAVPRPRDWRAPFEQRRTVGERRSCDLALRAHLLIDVGNGDEIALDPLDFLAPEVPVVYLSHEAPTSDIICPSMEAFLEVWAKLGCLSPHWLFGRPFIDDHGFLNAEAVNLADLRRLAPIPDLPSERVIGCHGGLCPDASGALVPRDGFSTRMSESSRARIRNHATVTDYFGMWPSFDGFGLTEMSLNSPRGTRPNQSELAVQLAGTVWYSRTSKRSARLRIVFGEVEDFRVVSFNHWESLGGVRFSTVWHVRSAKEIFSIDFLQGHAVVVSFKCRSVTVTDLSPLPS